MKALELGQVNLGLGLGSHDVNRLPWSGRFLRPQLQIGQFDPTAILRHGAHPDGLARLESRSIQFESMVEHGARGGKPGPRSHRHHLGMRLGRTLDLRPGLDAHQPQPVVIAGPHDNRRLGAGRHAGFAGRLDQLDRRRRIGLNLGLIHARLRVRVTSTREEVDRESGRVFEQQAGQKRHAIVGHLAFDGR